MTKDGTMSFGITKTIPADEGLLAMRRVIRRRYGDEQKALQAAE